MKHVLGAALLLGAMAGSAPALAQQSATISQTLTGTRLDLSAAGEVAQVPDVALINAGVTTRASTASSALQQAADRMGRVRSALKAAGIADRDIQTSNLSLNPEYSFDNNVQRLTGYSASNQLTIRFRAIANAGRILDVLVAQGSNQINGPNLIVDHPEAALDQARTAAIANGRARAELYARSMGLRVARIVSVAENGGGYAPPPPMPMMVARAERDSTKIDPGEQKLQVTLAMTFELQ